MNFERFRAIQAENAELCERKNRAYGDKNLTRFGAVGLVVRMTDKMERLINQVMNNGPADAETIRETAGDMANYATMLQGTADGTLFEKKEVGHEPNARGRNRGRVGRRGSRRAP